MHHDVRAFGGRANFKGCDRFGHLSVGRLFLVSFGG
jgi:hypothetical protein